MLKILVLFGSKSDEYVYKEIVKKLSEFAEVDFAVLSAHRQPEALDKKLKSCHVDFIVAGAGLAAHLPGVVASKMNVPVIGVPVKSVFAGLDAFASIQQMPFGVPVLATAPDDSERLARYLCEQSKKIAKGIPTLKVNLVFPQDRRSDAHFVKELKRTRELAVELGFELLESAFLEDDYLNINLASDESEVIEKSTVFHVPLLSDEKKIDPSFYPEILKWANKGGLWFGVNNCRNALKFVAKTNSIITMNNNKTTASNNK